MRRRAFLPLLFLPLLTLPLHPQALASAAAAKWGPAPPFLAPGARLAVLHGSPGAEGDFVVRLRFPNGYTVAPHSHPTDEHVTVISGKLMLGMGDDVDRKSATRLSAGGFITAPADAHHWAMAVGPTVVQVHGRGPLMFNYVRAADDPRNAKR